MSVTAAAGFRAAGVAAGLKGSGGLDLALVVNDGPVRAAAAVFTRNRVAAAPVLWSRQVAADGRADAVVLNSGGANACTGPAGFALTHATAERAADLLGCSAADVAVCSTGLIGVPLPLPKLLDGLARAVPALSPGAEAGGDAAEAIRTTDTVRKQAVRRVAPGCTVGGMAKGAAMLAPALATMLAVITTDAAVDPADLDKALRAATAATFERVDSDGCLSTNDTVLLLASGASGIHPDFETLTAAVTDVCADLASQMLLDAEGATKRIAVEVHAAATEDDALEVARAVARNALVKCAMFGADPNWGRIVAAVGTTEAAFAPDRLRVALNGVEVCRDTAPVLPVAAPGAGAGAPTPVDLTGRDITIRVGLQAGPATATVWTTDLTTGYVHENSAYAT